MVTTVSTQGTLKQVPLAPYAPDSSVARPVWYDRNPIDILLSAAVAVINSPQGINTLWNYTVPPGRKAMLELCRVRWRQITASTNDTQKTNSVFVVCTPASTGILSQSLVEAEVQEPTPESTYVVENIGQSALFLAGDNIQSSYVSNSTTGTFSPKSTAKFTEFDA
jgi:hypothetical protein